MRLQSLVACLTAAVLLSGCTLWQQPAETTDEANGPDRFDPDDSAAPQPTDPPAAQAVLLVQTTYPTQTLPVPGSGGDLLLLEREGQVLLFDQDTQDLKEVADLSDRVDAQRDRERGLKGGAFHPDFHENGMVVFIYDGTTDDETQDGYGHVVRYFADPDELASGLEQGDVLLEIDFPDNWFHNIAGMAFGPDGMLYVGVGDGANWRYNAQDLGNLWGTILRLDVDADTGYQVPDDNPFRGDPEARDEIWLYGLRNPWRFAFHPDTDDLFISDLGEKDVESVYLYPADGSAPRNHGWPYFEGNRMFETEHGEPPETNPPIAGYLTPGPGTPRCASIGGMVYQGDRFPDLRGAYLMGDHCSGELMFVEKQADAWGLSDWIALDGEMIISVDAVDGGEILVSTMSGKVYEVVPS